MIYIASDKHGFKAIKFIEEYLKSKNIYFENFGVSSKNEELSLEVMIPKVVKGVKSGQNNLAILVCGTGVGVEVGANKFSGIRACLATNEKIAGWSKVYDNCNVLCLAGWDAEKDQINKILDVWFDSTYDGDKQRLKMIEEFNKWH